MLPQNKETLDYVEYITGHLLDLGNPPPPNTVTVPLIHRYLLQKSSDRQRKRVIVEIADAAGEFYVDPEHELFNMIDYLNFCEGIIWLLDPVALRNDVIYSKGQLSRSYRQMIYRTLTRILQTKYANEQRIEKYMAFVFTKMDHPDHVAHFDDPQNYALNLLGKQTERIIENTCDLDRVEFFSVSALGFVDTTHTMSILDESDPASPRLRTKDIKPVGVFDPLNWLLSRLTEECTVTRAPFTYPVFFVWGQLIGRAHMGYSVVAHSKNLDIETAEHLRHDVMSQIRLPHRPVSGHAFAVNRQHTRVFFISFEESKTLQVGRNIFTQEYHVQWDIEAFRRQHSQFWSVPILHGQAYYKPQILDLSVDNEVSSSRDIDFLWNLLKEERAIVFSVLHSLISQNSATMTFESRGASHDLAVAMAVHMLVPPYLRQQITFASGVQPQGNQVFRVLFSDEGTRQSQSNASRFRAEQLTGFEVPGYDTLLNLFIEAHPERDGIKQLVDVLATLPVSPKEIGSELGSDLSKELWDSLGIQLVAKLMDRGQVGNEILTLALISKYGNGVARDEMLKRVAVQIRELPSGADHQRSSLMRLAHAIRSSRATSASALSQLPRQWSSNPSLVLQLCDELVNEGFSSEDRDRLWEGFIHPLLESSNLPRKTQIGSAEKWLATGNIGLHEFLQMSLATSFDSPYALIAELRQDGYVTDPMILREQVLNQRQLVDLGNALVSLETGDVASSARAMSVVASTSRPNFCGFITLLTELLLCGPSPVVLPHLLANLIEALDVLAAPPLECESATMLTSCLQQVSARSESIDTVNQLVTLAHRLGVNTEDVLRSLPWLLRIRYYLHRFFSSLRRSSDT